MKFADQISSSWKSFWFREYSAEFFKAYRFFIFLGASWASIGIWNFTGCELWNPIGLMNLMPCSFPVYLGAARVTLIFGVLAAVGIKFKWTSKITFLALLFQMGFENSFGTVSHSEHLITVAIGLMALTNPDGRQEASLRFGWQLQLIKVYTVWVYFVNGLHKIISAGVDWGFTENFYLILANRPTLGVLGYWLQNQPLLYSMAVAIYGLFVVELMAPLALLHRYLGYIFFGIWFSFHVGVTLTFGGHIDFFEQSIVAAVFLPMGLLLTEEKHVRETGFSLFRRSN